MRLITSLGVINIFAHVVEYPSPLKSTQKARVVLLRGSVKSAGHTAGQSGTRQATSVMGSTAVAEVKSTDQATRVVGSASVADRQSNDQATQRASTQISTEVLEVIEAIPYHEFFIQEC